MRDPQRYNIYPDNTSLEIEEAKDGEWVKWEDVRHRYVNSGVGYKLVPQEPTLEMQMAGAQCGPGAENQGKLMDAWSVYRRMVQASPSISNGGLK